MFIGEYQHSVDEKGRIAVPARFRAQLSEGAVVTRGLDNSLVLYPLSDWKDLATRLSALPLSQKSARAFARLMLAGAMEVIPDKQGRVILPGYLRKYAGIKTQAVVTGLYNRVEIWDEATWQQYRTQSETDSTALAEELGEFGV